MRLNEMRMGSMMSRVLLPCLRFGCGRSVNTHPKRRLLPPLRVRVEAPTMSRGRHHAPQCVRLAFPTPSGVDDIARSAYCSGGAACPIDWFRRVLTVPQPVSLVLRLVFPPRVLLRNFRSCLQSLVGSLWGPVATAGRQRAQQILFFKTS